jgi:uncharacterized protein with HEPN domain
LTVPPSLADRLQHILDAIADIEKGLSGKSPAEFSQDRLLRLAIERLLEVISEASRHIPDQVKARDPTIPWRRVADLGNVLRHAYHRVDPDVLWAIAINDLPALRSLIDSVIRDAQQ